MGCGNPEGEWEMIEENAKEAAYLLIYVCRQTGKPTKSWMQDSYDRPSHKDPRPVIELCAMLRSMDSDARTALLNRPNSPKAQRLRLWWQKHEAEDNARIEKEKKERQKAIIRRGVVERMTDEEREAFGFKLSDFK